MRIKLLASLCAIMLAVASSLLAGDYKPYKGWSLWVYSEQLTLDQVYNEDHPWLSQIINDHGGPAWYWWQPWGIPDPMGVSTYVGNNNVGGDSTHKNVYVYFFTEDFSAIEFYEEAIITVANGDQIYLRVTGIYDYVNDTYTATDTVAGGTGRFEGANGIIVPESGVIKGGLQVIIDTGYISTVGNAKKN